MAMAYVPKPGTSWNPLRNYRNVRCPCGCGKKAKRCMGAHATLPNGVIEEIKKYLRALSATGQVVVAPRDIA